MNNLLAVEPLEEMQVVGPMDTARISFLLGVRSDFNDRDLEEQKSQSKEVVGEPFDYSEDNIANLILDFMSSHKELEDASATLTSVKGLYRYEYDCPDGGEKLYKITSLYNPLYGQTKKAWFDTVVAYAKNLSEMFCQSSCTIIVENYDNKHPLQFIYIKNKNDNRRML